MNEPLPTHDALQTLALFRNVDLPSIAHHLERCQVHLLRMGDVLPDPAAVNRSAYLVLDGAFQVHRGVPEGGAAPQPHDVTFTTEMLMLEGLMPTMCIVAKGPARVLELSHDTLWSLARASHGVAMNLLGLLLRRAARERDDGAAALRHYEHRPLMDHLTDLYNRHGIEEQFPREILRARLQGRALSLLMLDVDDLRAYNDTHGNAAGDALLAALARELRTHLRPTDLVGRWGGDEFCVLLPDTQPEQAARAAERVRAHLERALRTDDAGVTVAAGIASMDAHDTLTELVARGSAALALAKAAGGNCVRGPEDAGGTTVEQHEDASPPS
jgi:diguanylate cyclase (GGDEF)-like protein